MMTGRYAQFQSLCRPTCFGLIALMSLVAPDSLWAQVDKGVITGTVADQSGAVIFEVRVLATNVDTGVAYSGTTNNVGIYQVQGLPIGRYSLRFEKPGFRGLDRPGLNLETGQIAQVNVKLAVGSATAQVEVVSAPPVLLDTETSTLSTVMNGKALEDLPLDINGGRDITTFISVSYTHLTLPTICSV